MKFSVFILIGFFIVASVPSRAQRVEEVTTASPDAPALPEDLFRLPPGVWAFARQLWKGDDACAPDECEAGYTFGELVVSVERSKRFVRIVAGFRDCQSVAWNEYEIGDKPANSDTKNIERLVKKTVGTLAKYCGTSAPKIPIFEAGQLFLVSPKPDE
jgi:hypothetical protein